VVPAALGKLPSTYDAVRIHFQRPRLAPSRRAGLPVLGVGVLEQFSQLQRVFADFLHGSQQKPVQRDVDHLLQQAAGFEEVDVLVDFGEAGELHAGVGVVVAVFGVYLKLCLLQGERRDLLSVCCRGMAWLPPAPWSRCHPGLFGHLCPH